MEFEFDPTKSMSNLLKHGISFDEARQLWRDPNMLIIRARQLSEPRWMAIGQINKRVWSAVYTVRKKRIRIISVRRSRAKEVALYES